MIFPSYRNIEVCRSSGFESAISIPENERVELKVRFHEVGLRHPKKEDDIVTTGRSSVFSPGSVTDAALLSLFRLLDLTKVRRLQVTRDPITKTEETGQLVTTGPNPVVIAKFTITSK